MIEIDQRITDALLALNGLLIDAALHDPHNPHLAEVHRLIDDAVQIASGNELLHTDVIAQRVRSWSHRQFLRPEVSTR